MPVDPPVSPRHSPPASRLGWTGVTTAAIGVLLVGIWGWCLMPAGRAPLVDLLEANAMLPLASVLAVIIWRATAGPDQHPDTRRAWRLLALGMATWLLAGVVWQCLGRPPVSVADALQMLYFPMLLAGVLAFPAAPRDRAARTRFWLDSGVVVLSGASAVWYFVLGPSLAHGHGDRLALVVNALYPIGDLVVLLAACVVLGARPDACSRLALRWAAAGIIGRFAGDVLYGWQMLHGTYGSGGTTDAAWLTSGWLMAVAAVLQRRHASAAQPEAVAAEHAVSLLPYASVAAVYAFLLVVMQRWLAGRAGGVLLCAVGVTALTLVRQLLAARETAALQRAQVERNAEARFRTLVQNASDVIAVLDETGAVRYVSPSVSRVLGYEPGALEGRVLASIVHVDDRPRAVAAFDAVAGGDASGGPVHMRVRAADGDWRSVESVGTNLLDDPTVGGIVVTSRDVSERAALQAELTRQAYHDPLTDLANRALFMDRVRHALDREAREPSGVAVLFLDLDEFKTVNDSLGHGVGDRLLVMVAERLLNATRGCDTVARLGGDEFAVLLENARHEDDAIVVAERVIRSLNMTVTIDGHAVTVGASVGVARSRADEGVEELVRNADVAMYKAKARGKGCYELFAPEMRTALLDRLELEADLRHAVTDEECAAFRVMYQPIVDLQTGEATGVEALLRWQHFRRGLVAPLDFIPMAESTGLIVPLGAWVLRQACTQAAAWQRTRTAEGNDVPLTVTVNISGRQLQHPSLAVDVAAALGSSGLEPASLVLEITESVIMADTPASLAALHALKALGVRLAIDDFGTGYSSLSYLQKFPIDILKIDKAFVDGVGRGGSDAALARTIVALGEMLALRCVAEGVEDDAQRRHLREIGCDYGQGYLFARPLTAIAAGAALTGGAGVAVGAGEERRKLA